MPIPDASLAGSISAPAGFPPSERELEEENEKFAMLTSDARNHELADPGFQNFVSEQAQRLVDFENGVSRAKVDGVFRPKPALEQTEIFESVGIGEANNPVDVASTKDAMTALGLGRFDRTQARSTEVTPEFFDAIETSQRRLGVTQDGFMRPGGETNVAFKGAMARKLGTDLNGDVLPVAASGEGGDGGRSGAGSEAAVRGEIAARSSGEGSVSGSASGGADASGDGGIGAPIKTAKPRRVLKFGGTAAAPRDRLGHTIKTFGELKARIAKDPSLLNRIGKADEVRIGANVFTGKVAQLILLALTASPSERAAIRQIIAKSNDIHGEQRAKLFDLLEASESPSRLDPSRAADDGVRSEYRFFLGTLDLDIFSNRLEEKRGIAGGIGVVGAARRFARGGRRVGRALPTDRLGGPITRGSVAERLLRGAGRLGPRVNARIERSLAEARGLTERVIAGRGGKLRPLPRKRSPVESPWPPNRGFFGKTKTIVLKPGAVIDRFGRMGGKYVSPQGTPIPTRSLRPGTEKLPFLTFEVTKPITVEAGKIAAWFGQPGGGIQYYLPRAARQLVASGHLRLVTK